MTQEIRYFTEKYPLKYGNDKAAGLDLPFYDPDKEDVITIQPGERIMLKTGIHVEIPEGHFGLLDSRSSTSKLVVDLLCRTIDEDFRGNIRTVLVNVGTDPVRLVQGNSYFQMIILEKPSLSPKAVDSVDELTETVRGSEGFGSTGNTTATGGII